MALSPAEKQRNYRQRHAQRVAGLEESNALLREQLATAQQDLADALAANERLSGGPSCRHPSEAVDGGTCRACGADVW
jgi:hypothetical protein